MFLPIRALGPTVPPGFDRFVETESGLWSVQMVQMAFSQVESMASLGTRQIIHVVMKYSYSSHDAH